ncbi:hypothetical protein CBR_g72657 [Chara braunii]|uniref:adenosylmethionine decarboxylase n=1 Tax=Chara braunii TaxID=69332 RepID=A0A388KA10_CHABU|nr:hypothetical protein CBR_g72657 [Chara braunii]|eukprot:GBG66902.1 hypothetical protein CBR_g72657 [Chara braunii]
MAPSLASGVSTSHFGVVSSLPAPGFEGFEKRLEVWFSPASSATCRGDGGNGTWSSGLSGLRLLSREELDALVEVAECTIVSQLSNDQFDAYVLSESSLFVYPFKLVMKTCGTTALLRAVPYLLKCAARLGLQSCGCKYTRGTFMFPAAQPYPHGSFQQEVEFLDRHFGSLGAGGRWFVLGDHGVFPRWHVYHAESDVSAAIESEQEKRGFLKPREPTFTLEMCMTELNRQLAKQFWKGPHFVNAKTVTERAGIADLLPGSEIDDFMFDPCGYSMNGVEGGACSTVHITPEDGFSYASFEMMGYDRGTDVGAIVHRVLQCFKPGRFSVAITCDGLPGVAGVGRWGTSLPLFEGYACDSSNRKEFMSGGRIAFHTFRCVSSEEVEASQVSGCSFVDPLPLFSDLKTRVIRGSKPRYSHRLETTDAEQVPIEKAAPLVECGSGWWLVEDAARN